MCTEYGNGLCVMDKYTSEVERACASTFCNGNNMVGVMVGKRRIGGGVHASHSYDVWDRQVPICFLPAAPTASLLPCFSAFSARVLKYPFELSVPSWLWHRQMGTCLGRGTSTLSVWRYKGTCNGTVEYASKMFHSPLSPIFAHNRRRKSFLHPVSPPSLSSLK